MTQTLFKRHNTHNLKREKITHENVAELTSVSTVRYQ